jgi:hypothetical protein
LFLGKLLDSGLRPYHLRMTAGRPQPLSFAVRQALIQACGTVFYYKGGLVELFASAGVPRPAVQRYVDQEVVKYQIARFVLDDLDGRGASGHRVQAQIVDAMLGLDGPADDAADKAEAKKALEALRRAAGRSAPSGAAEQQAATVAARKQRETLQRKAAEVQAGKVRALREDFSKLAAMTDKQERGYAFERFLADLFKASDLDYRGSYKVGAQQIDGAFKHGGRDFLVEARWREEPPAVNDLFTFALKATGKLDGTLGLFITMIPPREEVLVEVANASRNVLIMDGSDLALILEGRLTLPEALEFKRRRAAQEGILFASLANAHLV